MIILDNEPLPPKLSNLKLPWTDIRAAKEPATDLEIVTLFMTHMEYTCDGRWLIEEETRDIMDGKFYGGGYRIPHIQLKKFENPKDPLTFALQKISEEDKEVFRKIVGVWFHHIYENDPAFKKRADLLSGL